MIKKVLGILAATVGPLPTDIHSADVFITRLYNAWGRFYKWHHPGGSSVLPLPVVEVPATTEPATQAAPPAAAL